jgi:hypothetical protein
MMLQMRTTVTLDPDVEAKLKQVMRERGVSFKVALNEAVRSGLGGSAPTARGYRMQTYPMGIKKGVNIDKALQLAGELEDAEIIRKLELRK